MAKNWLQTEGLDGNRHVLFVPEQLRHILTFGCPCMPHIVATKGGPVLVHTTFTVDAEGEDAHVEQ